MSLRSLISPVVPNFPQVGTDMEIEVLHEIPIETLYLALKDSDHEVTVWFFASALPEQVQGLIDIDCWNGDEFLPDRFENYFKNLTLLSPPRIAKLMRQLDSEIVVRGLLEYCDVVDFDPQNPPEVPDENLMLTPDSKFALILKTDRPDIREMLYLWLNKFSAADIELLRRHLEACKWEQASDLEEFAYQVKKGRIEEIGFVDRTDALALYSVGKAAAVKEALLRDPLPDGSKISGVRQESTDDITDEPLNKEFLPDVISGPMFSDGFLFDAYKALPSGAWREVVLMEILRTINTALSADNVLHGELPDIKLVAVRARRYLDLGLSYLTDGKVEAGTRMLEVQPLAHVYRLGWVVLHDLVNAAKELRAQFGPHFFGRRDEEFLDRLTGRHPELDVPMLRDLGATADTLVNVQSAFSAGLRLAHFAQIGKYLSVDLANALKWSTQPAREFDNAFSRLMTGLFREAAGQNFSVDPLRPSEWPDLAKNFAPTKLQAGLKLIISRAPEFGRTLLSSRLDELAAEIQTQVTKGATVTPDPRFFKALSWASMKGN